MYRVPRAPTVMPNLTYHATPRLYSALSLFRRFPLLFPLFRSLICLFSYKLGRLFPKIGKEDADRIANMLWIFQSSTSQSSDFRPVGFDLRCKRIDVRVVDDD
jgi:hypothetical protein